MARTILNNTQIAKLIEANKVLGGAIDITGSADSKASVADSDVFLIQASSGVTQKISASTMSDFFASSVDVTETSGSGAHRIVFINAGSGDTAGASLEVDNDSLTFDPSTNVLTIATASVVGLDADTADIDGGNIDGTVIGLSSQAAGSFTSLSASSGIQGGSTLVLAGDADLNGALSVSGQSDFDGALNVTGAVYAKSSLQVDGAADLNDTLNVQGDVTFQASASVQGDMDIDGTLAATGAAHLKSTLRADGVVDFRSSMDVDGSATFQSTVSASSDISGGGTLAIAGASDLNGALSVAGDADLDSALNVTGAVYAKSTLRADGAVDFNSTINVQDNATFQADLAAVSGTFSGDVTITGDLTINGSTTTVNTEEVTIADHNIILDSNNSLSDVISGAGITLEGGSGDDITFQYDGSDSMDIKKGSSFYKLHVGDLQAADIDVVSASVDHLTVDGASDLNGALDVQGATNLQAGLTVAGATDYNGTGGTRDSAMFDVAGLAQFADGVIVEGALEADSTLSVSGAASLDSTLSVTGAAHLKSTLEVDGALQLDGISADTAALSDEFYFQGSSNSVRKESLADMLDLAKSDGIQISSGLISIDFIEDIATSASKGSVLSSDLATASLSQEPLADSVQVYLNGMLQVASGSAGDIFDYEYLGSASSRRVEFPTPLDGDDVVQIKYIKK